MPLGAFKRAAVLAHFDPHGELAPHVRRSVGALAGVADRLVVVSTASLTDASRRWLDAHAEVVTRPNVGHDFASYRRGLDQLAGGWDALMLANDSAVLPLTPLDTVIDGMEAGGADFWGITPGYGIAPHVQSYFMYFGPSVLGAPEWSNFWTTVMTSGTRGDVIATGEVRLSRTLVDAGFTMDTVLRPSLPERLIGAARADSMELRDAVGSRRARPMAGWLRRLAAHTRRPEWNAAVALADLSLRDPARLPAVKISTLRDDAYGLGTPILLSALERRYPVAFDGVRDYLERTDGFYGNRWATAGTELGPLRYHTP